MLQTPSFLNYFVGFRVQGIHYCFHIRLFTVPLLERGLSVHGRICEDDLFDWDVDQIRRPGHLVVEA